MSINTTALYPVSSEFDQTKESFPMSNIFPSVRNEVLDADFVSLLEVEEAGRLTHHLHGNTCNHVTLVL